jgi:hypothetical protein
MDTDKVVREQLLFLLRGGNAHMSFDQAVAGFPVDHINRQPPNVSYTPWHVLEHMRIAQWDILEFVRDPDHVSPQWPEGYWPAPDEPADESKWEKTINDFRADLRALQEIVEDPSVDLCAPLPHARDYTVLREILLVADHNAYHIGEFAIIRQVMDTWLPN